MNLVLLRYCLSFAFYYSFAFLTSHMWSTFTNQFNYLFQGIVTQLSEQISTLNERMDEFTSRIEELNSKVSIRKVSASQQNLALHADAYNATTPSSLFVSGVGNGMLSGSLLPNSSSSSQLARESSFMEEVISNLSCSKLIRPRERKNTKELTQAELDLVSLFCSEIRGANTRRTASHLFFFS